MGKKPVVWLIVTGVAWGAAHGRLLVNPLRPSERLAQRLPWSYPVLRLWAERPGTVDGAASIQLLQARGYGVPLGCILRLNPDVDGWEDVLSRLSPSTDQISLACAGLDPERPLGRQFNARFLRRLPKPARAPLLALAKSCRDPRRAIQMVALLADEEWARAGQLDWREGENPLRPEADALYSQLRSRLGLSSGSPNSGRLDAARACCSAGRSPGHLWDDLELTEKQDLISEFPDLFSTASLPEPLQAQVRLEEGLGADVLRDLYSYCQCRLTELTGLKLAQEYPQSRLANGCRAYSQIRGGSYYGDFSFWSGAEERPRRVPVGTPTDWRAFLTAYPDHPGADDAAYWLGRSLEKQGRRLEALQWFLSLLSALPGDRDMAWRWRDHVLWLLDVGTSESDLRSYFHQHPSHDLCRYAIALRCARRHDYQEALRITEGLTLARWDLSSLDWDEEDWSLAQPHVPQSEVHRPASTLDEDLAFQRLLWKRCESIPDPYRLAREWSHPGGWRIGYCLLLRGSRSSRWRFSWDAYASDASPEVRPDWRVLQDAGRRANQNEIVAELMNRVLSGPRSSEEHLKARYTRFAAFADQWLSAPDGESRYLGRDYEREIREQARLLLLEHPGSSVGDDVFAVFQEMAPGEQQANRFRDVLFRYFPDGDRAR